MHWPSRQVNSSCLHPVTNFTALINGPNRETVRGHEFTAIKLVRPVPAVLDVVTLLSQVDAVGSGVATRKLTGFIAF